MDLKRQVADFLSRYQTNDKKIVVALSGGIDSIVLLDIVAKLIDNRENICAVHVNHGLSQFAEQWLDFCRGVCDHYSIPFVAEQVKITDFSQGIEGAARSARYQALAKHVDQDTLLLTAQHRDDQTETLMLALKRGAGVRGLAAMPEALAFQGGLLIRPLLMVPRAAIEHWAQDNDLRWVEDDSNSDTTFDRNFLRTKVLPLLTQRWPSFSKNVARSASHCQQANQLLDEIALQDLMLAGVKKYALSLDILNKMSSARVNNVLRYWLRQCAIEAPSEQVLKQIVNQMLGAKVDSDPMIDLGCFSLRRYQGILYLVAMQGAPALSSYDWEIVEPLVIDGVGRLQATIVNDSNGLRMPMATEALTVRFGITGSLKSAPAGRDKRRSVKKLLQEYKVPPWQRDKVAFIFYDEQLVAAVGLWIDKNFLACKELQAIKVDWD